VGPRLTALPSGALVVSERMAEVESVALGVYFPTGSRHETAANNGISHMLEHLVFKGTSSRSADEVNREIDLLGGASNAYTSKETLCFHTRVLAEQLPRAAALFGDLAAHALPPGLDAEVEREREVVLSEISSVDDSPEDLLADLADRVAFGDHPLALPVVGCARAVARLSLPEIRDHFARHLVARDLVIAAAGRVEHEALVALACEHFAELSPGGPAPASVPPRRLVAARVLARDLEQVHVCLAAPGVPRGDPLHPAAELLSAIAGEGVSSRLFREVRDRRGLAYSIFSSLESYTDVGCLNTSFAVAPERLDEALDVVREVLAELARGGVRDDELAAAKQQLHTAAVLARESTGARMAFLAERVLQGERAPDAAGVLAALARTTREQVNALAARLGEAPLALAAVGPVEAARLPRDGLELRA
jgi:predicted Zn-dependent peptidase